MIEWVWLWSIIIIIIKGDEEVGLVTGDEVTVEKVNSNFSVDFGAATTADFDGVLVDNVTRKYFPFSNSVRWYLTIYYTIFFYIIISFGEVVLMVFI